MNITVFALVAALTLGMGAVYADDTKDSHSDTDPHDRVFLVQDQNGGAPGFDAGLRLV
jgi:hypothetical protein